jgi:hypothetical protein
VLQINTNLYFYTMWCGISYLQNYNALPNPTPFHSWHHFNPKTTEIVSFHTKTKSSGTNTVLNKHTTSIFKQPTEDTCSIFLWHACPQTKCYSNLDHIIFFTTVKTRSKVLQHISDNSVGGSCWENLITSITLFSLQTLFNAELICTNSVLGFFHFPKWNKERKEIIKLNPLGHSEMQNM